MRRTSGAASRSARPIVPVRQPATTTAAAIPARTEPARSARFGDGLVHLVAGELDVQLAARIHAVAVAGRALERDLVLVRLERPAARHVAESERDAVQGH